MSEQAFPPHETIWRSPPVVMFTAPNPGPKTLSGTHTFVVGTRALVIDPGPAIPSYQADLAAWLRKHTAGVQAILLTHAHPDHAPGAASLVAALGVPTLSSQSMPPEQRAALGVTGTFSPGQRFPVDGDALEVVATPGHTPDHVAFWLQRARILFAGDTVLGEGTTLIAPPEGNMAAYMRTLDAIQQLSPALIAPGHGPVIRDPDGKIKEYLAHRRQREDQLVHALAKGPKSAADLVRAVYTDVNPQVLDLALGSVLAQLEKLQEDGRVSVIGGKYALASGEVEAQ